MVVLAKMDTSIALSYDKTPPLKVGKNEGMFCLCDFTVLKVDYQDTVQETQCNDYLPDVIWNLKEKNPVLEKCDEYCLKLFNKKLDCEGIETC